MVTKKRYEHQHEPVMENEGRKILWDFSVQTDNVIEARRPDQIVSDKAKNQGRIIDFVVPFDSKLVEKERKKQKIIRIRREK